MNSRGRYLLTIILLTSCKGCQDGGAPATALEGEIDPPSLEITPKGVTLPVGDTLRFRAIARGTSVSQPSDLTWSASGGLIDQSGLFHAGDQAGTYEVRAEIETAFGILSDASTGLIFVEEGSGSDTGTEGPVPSGAVVLFEDGFESNDFRQWSGLAPAADPRWNGIGDGGTHRGDGYITNERVHSGQLAWKALIDPVVESSGKNTKSSLERWKGMGALEFYISAWYFIPTDYPAVNAQLMQIKAAGSGPSHKSVGFRISRRDKELHIRNGILGTIIDRTGVKAPVGRWFNLTGRFVIADSGLVEMWLDGQKIASVRTDTKDNDHAYPGVGNYIDDKPATCYIYIDDVTVMAPSLH